MQRSRTLSMNPARASQIPAVSRLLASRPFARLLRSRERGLVTALLRDELSALRAEVRAGKLSSNELKSRAAASRLATAVEAAAEQLLAPRPARVINATGVVVHTNLGRSPLSAAAAAQVAESASGYVDLEYDVQRGRRGSRLDHLAPLMERLFPGHGFLVVNNNAAATMLALRATSRRKEVVVSRGELVEIGGSFRVPDILAASGARLAEVGTTNRTRRTDYEKAIGARTGALLKVHTSNFKIVGFAEETGIAELARVAKAHQVPLIVDWGSGDLVDLAPLGIRDERPVGEILEAGADLVTFSGDKLLGGPQAGFIVGRKDLVERCRKDPMARVCRLDRLLLAALQRTLASYVAGTAFEQIPTLRMLSATQQSIGRRAHRVRRALTESGVPAAILRVEPGVSRTGGGSSPTGERPTRLLIVDLGDRDAGGVERRLRAGAPPVVGRMHDNRLVLDLRTVDEREEAALVAALVAALPTTR